jgi:hypothetical protein
MLYSEQATDPADTGEAEEESHANGRRPSRQRDNEVTKQGGTALSIYGIAPANLFSKFEGCFLFKNTPRT